MKALGSASLDDPFGVLIDEFVDEENSSGTHTTQSSLNSAPQAHHTPSDNSCWGAQLRGSTMMCSAAFTLGKGHFKNKASRCRILLAIEACHATGRCLALSRAQFCLECRTHGIGVLESRMRVVLPTCPLKNTLRQGFWNTSPQFETGHFRVISTPDTLTRARLPIIYSPLSRASQSLTLSSSPPNPYLSRACSPLPPTLALSPLLLS